MSCCIPTSTQYSAFTLITYLLLCCRLQSLLAVTTHHQRASVTWSDVEQLFNVIDFKLNCIRLLLSADPAYLQITFTDSFFRWKIMICDPSASTAMKFIWILYVRCALLVSWPTTRFVLQRYWAQAHPTLGTSTVILWGRNRCTPQQCGAGTRTFLSVDSDHGVWDGLLVQCSDFRSRSKLRYFLALPFRWVHSLMSIKSPKISQGQEIH